MTAITDRRDPGVDVLVLAGSRTRWVIAALARAVTEECSDARTLTVFDCLDDLPPYNEVAEAAAPALSANLG